MRKALILLLFLVITAGSLWADLEKLRNTLSDEEILILFKEELQFTNDLLVAQQLTTRAITLKQNFLKRRTGEIISDFDKLKDKAIQDEKIDIGLVVQMRVSLDSLKIATESVSSQIGGLIGELQSAKGKRGENQALLIQLAESIVNTVKKDKTPELPKNILPELEKHLVALKQSQATGAFDMASYHGFVDTFELYSAFLKDKGKDISLAAIYAEQLNLIGKNMDEFAMQVLSLEQTADEYKKLLATQEDANKRLESELLKLREYAEQRLFKEFVYFDSGSIDISTKCLAVLKSFANEYRHKKGYEFHVIGYSDKDPILGKLAKKYPSNWELSLARATECAKHLISQEKIDPQQIVITGRGEYKPFYSGGAIDKAKSRRVEIRIVKVQ